MQKPKENTKKKIVSIAKNEFLEYGFKGTSMRVISKKAGVTLSNIYNYFKNKDALLKEVLQPVLNAIEYVTEEHNKPEYMCKEFFTTDSYQEENFRLFIDLILNNKEELNLLLFHTAGSSFQNFRDEYTDKQTELGNEYLKIMKQKYPDIRTDISDFFIHTMSAWWLSIIGEIVSHNLSKNQIEQFIREYMTFATAGWKKLMHV